MLKDTELKTNTDRIRNMTNDELADFLLKVICVSAPCMIIDEDCKHFPNIPKDNEMCKVCFKEWLENKYITE